MCGDRPGRDEYGAKKGGAMTTEQLDVLRDWHAAAGGPLYLRLATALRGAIVEGRLAANERMLSERELGRALALSRSTVVAAYGLLAEWGLAEQRHGSGTWVLPSAARPPGQRLLHRSSVFERLLRSDAPTIDMALGTARALRLPGEQHPYMPDAQQVAETASAFQFAPAGLPALRRAIAARYAELGLPTTDEQILVTSGAQQAIALLTQLLVQRGDPALVESPTYFGALEILRLNGAQIHSLPFERLLRSSLAADELIQRHRPSLVYLTPTCHNPTGATLPGHVRVGLARLAAETRVPIVEDETLADLTIDGQRPPSIASYPGGEHLITIGSLGKLFWSGLRVGWVRADAGLIARLARLKIAADLGSGMLDQLVGARLVAASWRAAELRRAELGARRELLADLLRELLPEWEWELPGGGLFIWARLPHGSGQSFAQLALRCGVAVTPGDQFSADGAHAAYVRLPFVLDTDELIIGVRRLADAWRRYEQLAAETVVV